MAANVPAAWRAVVCIACVLFELTSTQDAFAGACEQLLTTSTSNTLREVRDCAFADALTNLPDGDWLFERVTFQAVDLRRLRVRSLEFVDCTFLKDFALGAARVDGDLIFRSANAASVGNTSDIYTRNYDEAWSRLGSQCEASAPTVNACPPAPTFATRFLGGFSAPDARVEGKLAFHAVQFVRSADPDVEACSVDAHVAKAGDDCSHNEIDLSHIVVKGSLILVESDFGSRVNLQQARVGLIDGLCAQFHDYFRGFETTADGVVVFSGATFEKDVNLLRLKSGSTLALDNARFQSTQSRRADVSYKTKQEPGAAEEEWYADVEMFGVSATDLRMQGTEFAGNVNLSGIHTGAITLDIPKFKGRHLLMESDPQFTALNARDCNRTPAEGQLLFLEKATYSPSAYLALEKSMGEDIDAGSNVFLAAKHRESTSLLEGVMWFIGYGRRGFSSYAALLFGLVFLRSRLEVHQHRKRAEPLLHEIVVSLVLLAMVAVLRLSSLPLVLSVACAFLVVGLWDAPGEMVKSLRLRKFDTADAMEGNHLLAIFGYVYVLLFAGALALTLAALKNMFW